MYHEPCSASWKKPIRVQRIVANSLPNSCCRWVAVNSLHLISASCSGMQCHADKFRCKACGCHIPSIGQASSVGWKHCHPHIRSPYPLIRGPSQISPCGGPLRENLFCARCSQTGCTNAAISSVWQHARTNKKRSQHWCCKRSHQTWSVPHIQQCPSFTCSNRTNPSTQAANMAGSEHGWRRSRGLVQMVSHRRAPEKI